MKLCVSSAESQLFITDCIGSEKVGIYCSDISVADQTGNCREGLGDPNTARAE